jgi:hypothetical protein
MASPGRRAVLRPDNQLALPQLISVRLCGAAVRGCGWFVSNSVISVSVHWSIGHRRARPTAPREEIRAGTRRRRPRARGIERLTRVPRPPSPRHGTRRSLAAYRMACRVEESIRITSRALMPNSTLGSVYLKV